MQTAIRSTTADMPKAATIFCVNLLRKQVVMFVVVFLCPTFSLAAVAGCAIPPNEPSGHVFYVDPVRGAMTNDGSVGSPWSTLHDVVANGLISTQIYAEPYRPNGQLWTLNKNGVIHSGDTIYLRTGDHGAVTLTGLNNRYITVTSEPGQSPVIDRLVIYGASKWRFRGIVFRSEGGWLVQLLNHNFHGPSDNIELDHNRLYSDESTTAWSGRDWLTRGADGIRDDATCSRIIGNLIFNVRNGIALGAENSAAEGNVIDNFADDGIDFTASNISILGNLISNNHAIGDGNHNDGIQGWTIKDSGEENVLIAHNLVANATSATLVMPGMLQGISIFDGKWRGVRVLGNTVLTNAWHGIALYGVSDSDVKGNTVIGTDPNHTTTWIGVFNMKKAQGGRAARDVTVRNNFASRLVLPDGPGEVAADHNLTDDVPQD